MARIAYFDAAAGASGDMILGALLDLGLPLEALRAELGRLGLTGFRLEAGQVLRSGVRATKAEVVVETREHSHRGLREILGLLEQSALDAQVKQKAAALFTRLAEAEASVHGTAPESVHFHEVGAIDSIVDVVGCVVGLLWLRADVFAASPLNVGGGSVTMDHGRFAVPPPATARLVRGVPVFGEGDFERLTPTGALLVTSYAGSYGPLPAMTVEAAGYGAGTRESPDRANVLRILVGNGAGAAAGRVLVLESEVDDMSPQLLGPLIDRLLAAGAKDAYLTPIHMKKGRPGILISVLADPERREALERLLFHETTTLGVRRQEWERTTLEREQVRVETVFGAVAVKLGRLEGRVVNAQPEFDDCQRLAAEKGVPVKEVWAAALAAFRQRPGASAGAAEARATDT